MTTIGFALKGGQKLGTVSQDKKLTYDLGQIKRALALFFAPGDVVEIRALEVRGKTMAGYFSDLEKAANEAVTIRDAAGIYVVLNPINRDLLARSANRISVGLKNLAQDSDVIRRLWLPIDIDAKRPKGISSTDAEHEAALSTAEAVKAYLIALDFPADSIAVLDSGNGAHVLGRVDLPNDASSKALIESCLKALAAKFDSDKVCIDQAVHNAARIWKLPGTLARKGDSTLERPHRLARIISAPETLTIAPMEALTALAATLPAEAPKAAAPGRAFDLQLWLQEHGIEVKSSGPYDGGARYILKQCPFNPEHGGTSAAIFQGADGKLGFKCQHNGCHDKKWADVRELFEPGYKSEYEAATLSVGQGMQAKPTISWPKPIAPEALHGLAGEVVRAINPHTEADEVAILTNFLVFFGNAVGSNPHARAEADRHGCNLNAVLVGDTAKGRKGSSQGQVRELFSRIDLGWVEQRVASGLSSGEGLIWEVRDPIQKMTKDEAVVVDEGVIDKRLLVCEAEFSAPLKIMGREGNTLSATLRQAWDSGKLRILTKNSPARATGAHISILAHITRDELLRYLNDTELGNGFANRFLWVCVKRSQVLPEGGGTPDYREIVPGLKSALDRARMIGELRRDDEARKMWALIYPELSEGKPGLFGAVTARAEAQVLRLSVLYAALDGDMAIRVEHLAAALAVWDYCEASARYIFGDSLGDPVADRILNILRQSPEGLTRTGISQLFSKHTSATRIKQALGLLQTARRVRCEVRSTEGRPSEVWFSI